MNTDVIYNRAEKKCELCGNNVPNGFEEKDYLNIFSNENLFAAVCPECNFKLTHSKTDDLAKELLEKIKIKEASKVKWAASSKDNVFNEKVKQALISSTMFEEELEKRVKKLRDACDKSNSEATIASKFEKALGDTLAFFNINYTPIREEKTILVQNIELEGKFISRTNKQGRIDSRYFDIITEYKKDIRINIEDNINQLKGYLESKAITAKDPLDKYFGILTDGVRVCFVSYNEGEWQNTAILLLNARNFKEIVKIYISLSRKELSAKGLVDDFSLDSESRLTLKLATTLYDRLLANDRATYIKYEDEWEKIFKLAGHNDNNNKAIKDRKEVLAKYFGSSVDETKALFCLHTSYAILIKMIAYNVLTDIYFKNKAFQLDFESLSNVPIETLKGTLLNIESGSVFKQVGIQNLLELDFFTWYLSDEIWNETLGLVIKECIDVLKEYVPNQQLFRNHKVDDFFKVLYQSIIPKEVRHSLGEYYTPDWLADHVVNYKLNEVREKHDNWRALDASCGSGTFVMFIVNAILNELDIETMTRTETLETILNRVAGYDLNPLAVLTCKINLFIAISSFIEPSASRKIQLPIKLGDSALIPKLLNNDVIQTTTLINGSSYEIKLPKALFEHPDYYENVSLFEEELFNEVVDLQAIYDSLLYLVEEDKYKELVFEFVNLMKELVGTGMSQSWLRTIFSILSTMVDGKYHYIVGNLPWIDWKSLPDGYREALKVASLEQHVFSGDTFTGGINLNICALILNVISDNWLEDEGYVGLLMPKSIVFQQTYTGFRNLIQVNGNPLIFDEFVDWTNSGNPFKPVTEKFMSYYLRKTDSIPKEVIPVLSVIKKKKHDIHSHNFHSFEDIQHNFEYNHKIAFQASKRFNNFTIIDVSKSDLIPDIKKIAGDTHYKGRVGLGLYPKEAMLLEVISGIESADENKVWVQNYKGTKTEKPVTLSQNQIEKKYLFPVIEGPNIVKFGVENVKYLAPLAYTSDNVKIPIPSEELRETSPSLLRYFNLIKDSIKKTAYNQNVQGKKGEFYSVTRVGHYTFAPVRVAFRNNTKWVASVIEQGKTPWGEDKMYLLLDHACAISQKISGEFITSDEAHYICALLNSTVAESYIIDSSDSRSFKTDLPLRIDEYDQDNPIHVKLSELSKEAHADRTKINDLMPILDDLVKHYLN